MHWKLHVQLFKKFLNLLDSIFSDLAEAEAELVAGYFVEYSAMSFALFFLGEYSNMGRVCVSLFY